MWRFKFIVAKYFHEFISRSSEITTPSFLNFRFEYLIPPPNYERIIAERDEFGRIIHSKAPPISEDETTWQAV